ERAGADGLLAHRAAVDVTRVNRRPPTREEEKKRRLRPAQPKAHLILAFHDDFLQVREPRLARAPAPAGVALFRDCVPGAFDIGARERLAVVPFHAAAQLE